MRTVRAPLITLLLATVGLHTPAMAQVGGNGQPVELIVPYAPGGASDIIVRALAPHLGKTLNQNVVVLNRAGANTAIAATQLARTKPDGHTLMLGDAALVLNVAVREKSPGYDLEQDFTPVLQVGSAPLVLFTPSAGPADLKTFLDKGKTSELSIANAGPGSLGHLAAEQLRLRTDLKIISVPYRGSGPAMNETLGGHVDATFTSTASGMPLVENGQLHALAVAADEPSKDYPSIPTFASQQLNGVKAINWWGLIGPAGMPPDVTERLANAMNTVMQQPEIKQRFAALGITPTIRDSAAFAGMMREELTQWRQVAQEAGVRMD